MSFICVKGFPAANKMDIILSLPGFFVPFSRSPLRMLLMCVLLIPDKFDSLFLVNPASMVSLRMSLKVFNSDPLSSCFIVVGIAFKKSYDSEVQDGCQQLFDVSGN